MNNPAGQPAYLRHAVERLLAALGDSLIGVVLYGSHARGEAREGSDVDLFVIARGLPERRYERAIGLQRIVRGIEGAPDLSLLGKTPEEFEGYFPSLYLDIGLDGIVLFDREGYTARRLARVREIIRESRLVRERDNEEMFWRFNREQSPGPGWSVEWEGFRERT